MTLRIVYTLCGFIVGSGFPLCALTFARSATGAADSSFYTYATQAHLAQPLYYWLDAAPLIFALVGFLIGRQHDGIARTIRKLRREVTQKTELLTRFARQNEARRRLDEQLTRRAFEDPLTRLANRALFTNRTEHALARAGSRRNELAVLLLDLDDFKTINDTLGYDQGDLVLVAVAQRISALIRPYDTLARLGGDEYALLLERITGVQDAVTMAQAIIEALATPIQIQHRSIRVGISIGIVGGRNDAGVETLLRDAGLAMTEAKSRGKDCLRVFRPEMHAALVERVRLGGDLQKALATGQFFLVYQPIVDLATQRIVGMEALVRWNHPQRGMVSPLEFIKLAEDTNAIVPLGNWILQTACAQMAAWHATRSATIGMTMTVNVSPIQLHHHTFVDDVRAALVGARLPAKNLVLEITESALVEDTAETLAIFSALKTLGVRLAIDDFGTGYSSLSYLQRFPFDILKIDKSFVDGVAGGGTDAAFARTITALGNILNLRVLAEGIEHANQLAVLREMGCAFGQGYLFAKPLDPVALSAKLDVPLGTSAPLAAAI